MVINYLKHLLRSLPLRIVILAPFLFLIFLAVGVTSVLSLRTGHEAVNEFAAKFLENSIKYLQHQLEEILAAPPQITKNNLTSVSSGDLDLENLPSWKKSLIEQLKLSKFIGTIGFGNERGEAVWVQREESDTLIYAIKDASTDSVTEQRIDILGNPIGNPFKGSFDPRKRLWYIRPAKEKKPIWSEIYLWYQHGKIDTIVGISYGEPYYDGTNSLQGVLVAEPSPSKINKLLNQIEIGYTRKIFIIERLSGLLVANSFKEKLYRLTDNKKIKPVHVLEITDPLIRRTAEELFNKFARGTQRDTLYIDKIELFDFEYGDQQQLVQVAPLQLPQDISRGVDWLIVVVRPEDELMKGFKANTRNTILLGFITLLLVTIIGFFLSRLITKPIQRVSEVAKHFAIGKWDKKLLVDLSERSNEIGELARSFNNMAEQLKTSFANLEAKNAELLLLNKQRDELVGFGIRLSSKIHEEEMRILEFIHNEADELMDTKNMYIALYDDVTNEIRFPLAFKNDERISIQSRTLNKEKRGRTEEIILLKETILIHTKKESREWYEQPEREEKIGDPWASWIGVPMKIGEKVLGVVATYHPTQEYVYNEDDLEILQSMADLAAIALENARLYEEAKRLRDEKVAGEQLATLGTTMAALQHRISNTFDIIVPNLARLKSRVNMQDATIADIFDIIERNGRATSDIIRRIQEPLREIEAQSVQINAVLDEEVKKAKDKWKIGSVSVKLKLDDSIPQIRIPSGQIAEVFSNLLDNAYRAMSEKEGELNISSFVSDNRICVRFQDAGPGIPPEVQSRLFIKPVPVKGSGLGLWLSQLILKGIRGSIKIEKSDSTGTTMLVQISLPGADHDGGKV